MNAAFVSYVMAALLLASGAAAKESRHEKSVSAREANARAIHHPHPDYPREARRLRMTGSGSVLVRVGADGKVISATIQKSTGHALLDGAILGAFRQWEFPPGEPFSFVNPVVYRVAGEDR
jgi:TonB family protein